MGPVRVHCILRSRAPAARVGTRPSRDGNPTRRVAAAVRLLREAPVKLRTLVLVVVVVASLAIMWLLVSWKNQPPDVQFVKVSRETITSGVPTNGKVEPIEWATARPERAGLV